MNKKILATSIAFFVLSSSVNAEPIINIDTTQGEVKIGSDMEILVAGFFTILAGLSLYASPLVFFGSMFKANGSMDNSSIGLKFEVNTTKANIKNNLDKSIGGVMGLNFLFEKSNALNSDFFLMEVTPSAIFKKGEIISLLYDAGIGYKKKNLLGFLDAGILVGVSAGIPYSSSGNLTIPKQPKTSDGKDGTLFGGGCFARAEIGVKPLSFIGNDFLTLTLGLGYRFFNAKDAIGINSINSDIKVSF